jgi:predicted amidophosphoribosyltransferase
MAIYEDALGARGLAAQVSPQGALGKWFGPRLAELVRSQGEAYGADIVVPVPLHRDRLKDRGFHQAALLAKPPAKALKLPSKLNLLVRTREPGRKSGCSQSKSGGDRSVARLPHGQAAKLTSYASYW